MSTLYDALIIGGGPAGSTAALLLARAGWSVALIERKVFPRRKVCGEYLSATNLPLLARLGLAEEFRGRAGPLVTRVGLFAGRTVLQSALPRADAKNDAFGQALAREHLDTLLRDRAVQAGAVLRQPCAAVALHRDGERFDCRIEKIDDHSVEELSARIVIAAHGSWDIGALPTQRSRLTAAPSDLLGFKAHFTNSDLPAGLMPLLAFPGGYGGMVHCDGGRISLSLCIRRDSLTQLRAANGASAGETIQQYLCDNCFGVKHALTAATRAGDWLATGPIQPGIRLSAPHGVFLVGNAAGEAHPVVAEGISMAMQGAWLLAERLLHWKREGGAPAALAQLADDYAAAWRGSFAPRLRASSLLAQWAMRRSTVAASLPLLRCFPHLLSWGARLSGKATRVVSDVNYSKLGKDPLA